MYIEWFWGDGKGFGKRERNEPEGREDWFGGGVGVRV
jgi:hypothetical protein